MKRGRSNSSFMPRLLSALLVLLTLSYPFLVYFGWQRVPPRLLLGASILLFASRFVLSLSWASREQWKGAALPWILPVIFLVIAFVVGRRAFYFYWPSVISASLLFTFARTLWRPPPLVERFARLQKPVLSAEEVAYCRKVTQLWCLFFFANGSVSLELALGGALYTWALYNGFISYFLIGAFFSAEYLYRHWRFRPKGAWLSEWMNRWIR
jgi:uncharacterized membrane protein